MYYEHFGLNYPPFKITPDPQLFYPGGSRGLVLEALVYAVTSGEGIVKLVGEVGSGKTTLCRMLEEKLPKHIEVVYLANPRLPPEMILHAIALEMRLSVTPESNRLQVMHELHLKLLEKHEKNQQVVIFIEEAQEMPLATLEEVRLLSNLETSRHKLLQIVLFGQPELDTHLSMPHIRQLKERITHSFYLRGLTRANVEEYLNFRMRAVGYRGPPVFSKAAVRTLTKASKGLLRRINILADKALLAAFAENKYHVTAKHVKRASRDSGFRGSRFYQVIGVFVVGVLIGLSGWWFWPSVGNQPLMIEKITQDALLQQRVLATQQWLTKASGQAFTLQVMQTTNLEDLIHLLRKPEIQPLLEDLYLYQDNLTHQWEVFYAEFTDASSAFAAIEGLPRILQRNKPFLRKIAKVRS